MTKVAPARAGSRQPLAAWAPLALVLVLPLAAACDRPSPVQPSTPAQPGGPEQQAPTGTFVLSAAVDGTGITGIVATATGAGIAAPITANLTVARGRAAGVLTVPVGGGRTLQLTAYGPDGRVVAAGSTVLDVVSGQNPAVAVRLVPAGGGDPVVVAVDPAAVLVRAAHDTAAVGDTVRFSAVVVGPSRRDTLPATVRWMSLSPQAATVSDQGLALLRDTGRVEIAAGVAGVAGTAAVRVMASRTAIENSAGGTRAWYWSASEKATVSDSLAVWAAPYSVRAGDSLDVYVHSVWPTVSIAVFRMGWYGGQGARRFMTRTGIAAGKQPPCAAEGPDSPVVCRWSRTTRLPIGADWPSGMYLLRVYGAGGTAWTYPFVVTTGRRAQFTVVIPQFTWQAYNDFGGSGLYVKDPSGAGTTFHHGSFERPYRFNTGSMYTFSPGYSNEVSAIFWLEKAGYDVEYESDVQIATGAGHVDPSVGLIYAGHDEYWTWEEMDRVQRLRDGGTHLMFLAGNTAYWAVRLSPGAVTGRPSMVVDCYKRDPDTAAPTPWQTTGRFRDAPLNRPENALVGVMYTVGAETTLRSLFASDSTWGPEAREFMAAGGIQPGDSVRGAAAGEGDNVVANGKAPPNLQVLFRAPVNTNMGGTSVYYTTFYVAPSGAGVFASGNNEYARILTGFFAQPESVPLERMMASVLSWMQHH